MNKLFLSLILVLPISLHAMDNPQRLLIYGSSALAVGVGGHKFTNMCAFASLCKLNVDLENNANTYNDSNGKLTEANKFANKQRERRTFIIGAMRSGSYLSAGLLAQYAGSGKLPASNMQTAASALAIATGGGLFAVGRSKKRGTLALLSGAGLMGLGIYGLYKNS